MTLMAMILGKADGSSRQVSPLSSVSHTLPPVVPKQNSPWWSPSKAPLSTEVNCGASGQPDPDARQVSPSSSEQ